MNSEDLQKLSAPFDEDSITVKVQSLSKDRTKAMLVTYIAHYDVADRLDKVCPGWSFKIESFVTVRSGAAELVQIQGSLTINGVTRQNFGEGEDHKSAASDCLKRCASLFGVARYLYDQEKVWVPYNEEKDKFKKWTYAEYKSYLRNKPEKPVQRMEPRETPKEGQSLLPSTALKGKSIYEVWSKHTAAAKGLAHNVVDGIKNGHRMEPVWIEFVEFGKSKGLFVE